MTIKTTSLGGTNWSNGDILYAADQNDTINEIGNNRAAWINLASGTLSGASISVASIPTGYKVFKLFVSETYFSAAGVLRLTLNNDTGAAQYLMKELQVSDSNNVGGSESTQNYALVGAIVANPSANNCISTEITVFNRAAATYKHITSVMHSGNATTPASMWASWYQGRWKGAAEINRIDLLAPSGQTFSAGTYVLLGCKY